MHSVLPDFLLLCELAGKISICPIDNLKNLHHMVQARQNGVQTLCAVQNSEVLRRK